MMKMIEDKTTKMTEGEMTMIPYLCNAEEPMPTDQDLDDLDTINEWLKETN